MSLKYDPEIHYDRVMPAWKLLMGRNLHYGYFRTRDEDLDTATDQLTRVMAEHTRLRPGLHVLDVGCGDGETACFLAEHFGCAVTGISTGRGGVQKARRLALERGLSARVKFHRRDGMDNRFPAASFDRVWVIQASHLMLDKRRLLMECARVVRPGGRIGLCDIILRAPLREADVIGHRDEFLLLHQVFGRARLEPLAVYRSLAEESGLRVEVLEDLSDGTLPTFDQWRRNAAIHRDRLERLIGDTLRCQFLEACDVLERFWKEGKLGYGMLAADRRD